MKRMIQSLSLILAFFCLLSACGAPGIPEAPASAPETQTDAPTRTPSIVAPQTTQSAQEQTGYAYQVTWQNLNLSEGTPIRLLYQGDQMLLELSIQDGGRGLYNLERGTLLASDGLPGEALTVAADGESLWYCVKTDDGLCLCRTPGAGGAVEETVSLPDTQQVFPYSMAVDQDGYFYLLSGQKLMVYSQAGKRISDLSIAGDGGINLIRTDAGQILLATNGNTQAEERGGVKLVSTEAIGATLTDTRIRYRIYESWPGTALLSDGGQLYALDMETKEMATVLDWIDTDINPETLISVAASSPDSISLLSGDEDGVLLGTLQKVPAEPDSRTVLNVGVNASDALVGSLQAMTVAYNQSQSDVRIHLVNYGVYRDRSLQEDAKDLDLLLMPTGTQALDTELTDLRTLYDSELGEDTLMPCVKEAFSQLDALNQLPLCFHVRTLVGKASLLGEAEGWTPQDLLEAARQHPDAAVLQFSTSYDALDLLLEGEAYVTDFAPILEAAATLPADDAAMLELPANQTTSAAASLRDGTLLLHPVTLRSFSDLQVWNAALEGDLVYKGYPVNSGNGGLLLFDKTGFTLSIPASSTHPQEAWAFLKAVLQDDAVAQYTASCGFPILKSQFDAMEQDAMRGITYSLADGTSVTTGGTVNLNGELYEVDALSEETAAHFRTYLDQLSGLLDTRDFPFKLHLSNIAAAKDALKTILEDGTDPAEAAKPLNP